MPLLRAWLFGKVARLLLFALWLLAACNESEPLPLPGTTPLATPAVLNIGLSDAASAIPELVIDAYAQQNDRVKINFVVGNNRTLFEDLESGHLDAILVYHIAEGSEHWFNPIALDGLAIVVHRDNPVRNVNLAQVQGLFSGEIINWSGLGGGDRPANPVGREPGAGTRTLFNQRVMAEKRASINTLIEADSETLRQAVAADPGAVGYMMMSAVEDEVAALTIDGIAPSSQTTATQTYPLTVPLYFVSPREPEGELRAFLAWLQSESGQLILGEKFGRVS